MISRQSALVFMNNVLAAGMGYVAMFFILQYMGKEALGTVAFAISFAGLFSFIANLGFDSAHTKRISEGKDIGKCNGTYFSIKLALIAAFMAVVSSSIYVWKNILGNGFESPTHEKAIYIAVAYWSIFSFINGFIATFNGRREIAKSQTIRFFNDMGRSTLLIFFSVMALGVLSLVGAYLAGTLMALLVAVFFLSKLPVSRPDREYIRSYVKFALPLAIAASMVVVASNTDVVMIQWFWSSSDVADYYAAKRIAMLLTMISMAVGTALYPALSSYHSHGNMDALRVKTISAERYLSMLTFPVAFFIMVFPENILNLLSQSMVSAVSTLRMLVLLYALIVLNYPYNNVVAAMDRTSILGTINIIRALLNIGLNLVFIPVSFMGVSMLGLGAFGAAAATFLTFLVTSINLRIAAYRLSGVVMDKSIFKHISAALLTSILFVALDASLWATRWYHLVILALLFASVYFLILFLIREFTKQDYEMLLDAAHPAKMASYVHGELRGKK